MLVDANLLVYAVDSSSPFNSRALDWLTDALNGARRVGLPWESLTAFVRLVTHPRVMSAPLDAAAAWQQVEAWLACDVAWVPQATRRHADVLGGLVVDLGLTANLVSDAHLAALAIEHGLTLFSADSDFARFPGLTWRNPLTEG